MPTADELRFLQSLPLEVKIAKSKQRIREWVEYWGVDDVAVSFSGGKDSTVLLHLVREMYPSVEAVFCNTGLEFPEIQDFAKSFENVTVLRPKMSFVEVIKKHGYPFISKEVAERVETARRCLASGGLHYGQHYYQIPGELPLQVQQLLGTGGFQAKRYDFSRWKFLLDVDFRISGKCCNEMKKKPFHSYKKHQIVGTMAEEGQGRQAAWLKFGCNSFEGRNGTSKPLSFWLEQDVLRYIKTAGIPIAGVYGDVVYGCRGGEQYTSTLCEIDGHLCTTGAERTGCMFCGFGAHLSKGESRFQRMKRAHPKQYDYCMGGGEYDEEGLWVPNKNGLGMAHCIDEINRLKGKVLIKY